jgi:hypothetical protein
MTRQRTGLLLALTCLLLPGCGGSTFGAAATATPTHTPLPTATSQPSPTATPTQPPSLTCADVFRGGNSGAVQHGDFLIVFAFGLAYPARQLPDGLPLKPYQFTTQPPEDPAVNPHIAEPLSGFDLTICNAGASASHTLGNLAVTIQSFTPYTGQLNTWAPCNTTYTRQGGPSGGGCGGGVGDANCFQATFPSSASTGATASLATTTCAQQPLPVTLKPNDAFYANLGVIMPTAPGTYGIALTYTADGAAPVSVPFADHLLLAPVAHDWDGQACTSPTMQAQIPAANPTTPYICPKS